MTRVALTFTLVAALSTFARAEDAPTDGGAKPDAAPASPLASPKPKFKNVPPFQLASAQLGGDPVPHLPLNVKLRAKGPTVIGMYKICVGTDGNVAAVYTIESIPGFDDIMISTLRTWKYKPFPEGVCSMSRFVYTVR